MDPLVRWLWYANLAAMAVLTARIAVSGLHRVYPFLVVYFLGDIGGNLTLAQIPFDSDSYAVVYMAVQSMLQILAVAAVLEMYRVALAKHPGLAGFGRASVLIVTLGIVAVAAVGTLLDKDIPSGQSVVLHHALTLERTLDLVIFVFLLLVAGFITWFPVKLPRNTAVSIGGFSLLYFTRAAVVLAANLLPRANLPAVNHVFLGISLVLLLAWVLVLRPEKGADTVTGHSWDPAALAQVSRQLDAINSALVRFGRR